MPIIWPREEVNMKKSALAIATLMVMCAFSVVCFAEPSDADPPQSAPTMKFWVYGNNGWEAHAGNGYDATVALDDSDLTVVWATETVNGTTVSGSQMVYQYTSGGWTYSNINPYYGKVTSVNGLSAFTAYYYDESTSSWVVCDTVIGNNVLGFYKPFDDYVLATANIAFVPANQNANDINSALLASVAAVTHISCYEVTFHVGSDTYIGYGSDCATAFKDAMETAGLTYAIDLSMHHTSYGQTTVNSGYYGEVTTIGNQSKTTTYHAVYDDVDDVTSVTADYYYWGLYLPGSPNNISSTFMLGFMSPLAGMPAVPSGVQSLTQNEFVFDYEYFQYSWVDQGDTTPYY